MKHRILVALGLALVISGCSGKNEKKKGRPLNIPPLQPPVVEATPSGFSTDLSLAQSCGDDIGTPIERLKYRLFCPGPGDFRERLGAIDHRIAQTDQRAQDNLPVCVDDELKDWTPTGIPESFPLKISCYEEMVDSAGNNTSGLTVYFGQDASHSYIIETQDPPPGANVATMGVYAKIDNSGEQVSFWQGFYDSSENNSTWMKLTADRSAKTMEFVAMGTTLGYGVGCGINLKSNADLVYVKGVINDQGFPGGCNNANGDWQGVALDVDLCLNATTMAEVAKSQCQTAGLTTLTMEQYKTSDVAQWDQQQLGKKLVAGGGVPAGVRSFTESRLPTGEE